jgi:lysophospholipase L1-like esterase
MGDTVFPAAFTTMLPLLRRLCPGAAIGVTGLAPMQVPGLGRERIEAVNSALSGAARGAGCSFLDLAGAFDCFCRPVGNPCFEPDGVHFSAQGYEVLAGLIREHFTSAPLVREDG